MTFKPLSDRVLVQRDQSYKEDSLSKGGIIMPSATKEKPNVGTIIATGPGGRKDSGELITMQLKEGDTVMFGKYNGQEINLEGEDFIILRENEILGVLC